MSQLNFRTSEVRFATAVLATVAALAPALYFLSSSANDESTEHIKTFNKLIQNYSKLSPEILVADATWDFMHVVLPTSLGLPPRTLAPFSQHAGTMFSLFSDFQMIPQPNGSQKAIHLAKDTSTVIAHCKMGGKVNAGSDMGAKLVASGILEWRTECVLFVRMTVDGKGIVEVREFVDSAKAEKLQERLSGVLSG
jgi:hypothetical protein